MATNDLMSELQKDSIKLDDDSERKVVRMLLRLLEDKNGEVQNLAVRCLGPLVGKVKDYQVRTRSCRLISISNQRYGPGGIERSRLYAIELCLEN